MTDSTEIKGLEEFENKMLKQENQRLQQLKVNVDNEVLKLLYEKVLLEIQPHLHKLEMMQSSLLALYGNKVDPKRFPLTEPEQVEAIEMIKDGYEAFLEGLKEDFGKADNAEKRMSDAHE